MILSYINIVSYFISISYIKDAPLDRVFFRVVNMSPHRYKRPHPYQHGHITSHMFAMRKYDAHSHDGITFHLRAGDDHIDIANLFENYTDNCEHFLKGLMQYSSSCSVSVGPLIASLGVGHSSECCENVVQRILAAGAFISSMHTCHIPGPDALMRESLNCLDELRIIKHIGGDQWAITNIGKNKLSVVYTACEPRFVFRRRDHLPLEDCTTLEMLLELEDRKWQHIVAPGVEPEPYEDSEQTDDRVWYTMSRRLSGTTLRYYLLCLLQANDIFSRSDGQITCIHHFQPLTYYRAMFQQPCAAIVPGKPSAYYKALLCMFEKRQSRNPSRPILMDDATRMAAIADAECKEQRPAKRARARRSRTDSPEPGPDFGSSTGSETPPEFPIRPPKAPAAPVASGLRPPNAGGLLKRRAPIAPRPPVARGPRPEATPPPDPPAPPPPPHPIARPRRDRRPGQDPDRVRSSQWGEFTVVHGDTVIWYNEYGPVPQYVAKCAKHTGGSTRCVKSMQVNQPSPDIVVKRLRYWLNHYVDVPSNIPLAEQKREHLQVPIPLDPGDEADLIASAPSGGAVIPLGF